jgi:hypothetical protein
MRKLISCILLLAALALAPVVRAGEADDLQRMIDHNRQSANDLERLDEHKAVREDLTAMRMWLDQAWTLRSQEKYDEVRVVLDRCKAQGDMIREKINASKLNAQAKELEAEVQRKRANLERTKKALENAKAQKIRLEAKS